MIANGRRRKKKNFSLRSGSNIIQGTSDLVDHATAYYQMLFGPAEGFQCRLRSDVWSEGEKLSDTDNEILSKPFSEEEIKKVVDGIKKQGCWL